MIMTGNPKIRPGLAAWALAATLLALTLPAWSQATTQATVPFSISPETTNIAQPLLADGTPDYLAVLNAKYAKGVTPENNAFIPFMKIRGTAIIFPDAKTRPEILKLLGTQESPPDEAHYSTFATYLTNHPSAIKPDEGTNIIVAAEREMWTATDHPELAAYLQAQGPIFDRLIEASKLPHFYAPFCSPTGNLVEVPVPRAAGLVEIFRAWITRPTLRAATGDIDGAAADLRAMKQLARLLPRQGTIIFTLLGYVADNIATDAAGIIAASGKLTAAQCDTLARALDLPPMPNLADIYNTNERWRALQLFQWTFKGKFREAYGSDLTAQQAATFNSIDWQRLDGDAFLKEFNIFRDREVALYASTNRAFIAALAKSLGEDVKQWADDAKKRGDSLAPDVGESKADYTTRIMHSIVSITTPRTYAQSANLLDRQFLSDMLPTLFAAAKFKAQTGAWPVSLNQLVPGYIKEIPADPYGANSAPIQYTLIDGHPRLFSIGPDRAPGTSDDLAIGQPLPPPATLPTPPTPPATRSDLP